MHDRRPCFRFFHSRLICHGRAAEAFCRGLRGYVSLRRSEHLVANHEFAHSRGTKQRRIEGSMRVPLGVWLLIGRPRSWDYGARAFCR